MVNKKDLCTKYLEKLGRTICYVDSKGEEVEFCGVIQQTWRKNKTRFDDVKTEIGRVDSDFYLYLGPYHIDICALPEDTCLICDGVKYLFLKKDKVSVGDSLHFFTGVLRRVWEDEDGYFE